MIADDKKDKEAIVMSKRLVAFFSASGNTKKIAQTLAEAAGADLYEITPRVAYTSADLNWMDKKSRSSVEMKDKKIRPELGGESLDIDPYDEIVLGFPIWWYPLIFPHLQWALRYTYLRACRQRCGDLSGFQSHALLPP